MMMARNNSDEIDRGKASCQHTFELSFFNFVSVKKGGEVGEVAELKKRGKKKKNDLGGN